MYCNLEMDSEAHIYIYRQSSTKDLIKPKAAQMHICHLVFQLNTREINDVNLDDVFVGLAEI